MTRGAEDDWAVGGVVPVGPVVRAAQVHYTQGVLHVHRGLNQPRPEPLSPGVEPGECSTVGSRFAICHFDLQVEMQIGPG